ncbi:MAG: hypothetical protein RL660_1517 [Bacteroidota bacterium]|jgi:hypothetical protein
MKQLLTISALLLALTFSACEEQCFTSYDKITLKGVTKKTATGTDYKGWYVTDYFVNELNLKINYNKHTELYADCKNFTLKHGIVHSNIKIQCNNPIIVGTDTLPANTNLYPYFTSTNYDDDVSILTWDAAKYAMPRSTTALNMLYAEVPLSDGIKLSSSALVSLTQ